MTNDFADSIIKDIRALYRTDEHAQLLFDWTAARERDASVTSIDRIAYILNISRGDAVALARKLEEAGCGRFINGRRGQKSRFEWKYSCISLGQTASGESSDLEDVKNPVPDIEEETASERPAEQGAVQGTSKLSIADAKAAIALSLGIPIANIEIIIRA